eukprot:2814155-Ditylum_brightwellii.AAC.1
MINQCYAGVTVIYGQLDDVEEVAAAVAAATTTPMRGNDSIMNKHQQKVKQSKTVKAVNS